MGLHWEYHPAVRSGMQLTLGERAADRLKATFGSWPFMIVLNGIIFAWIGLQILLGGNAFDPFPYILLNLALSWLAAQQGGALQIAANRGDRIASEVARETYENGKVDRANGEKLMEMNAKQLEILRELRALRADIAAQDDTERTAP